MLTTCLLTAIGALSTAIGVMWRQHVRELRENAKLRLQLDALHASSAAAMAALHAAHLADVKELTTAALHVAEAATFAPPLASSRPPRLASGD